MNCQFEKMELNFQTAVNFINQLPVDERHLVLLPELWTSGFSDKKDAVSDSNYQIIDSLKSIAKSRNMIIAGSYIIKEENDYYNQLIIINGDGDKTAKYNKNHLFPQMREKSLFTPGDSLSILKVWGVNISMAICYDLRFPELFRNYAILKTEICLLPAQWPSKRLEHFRILLSARAIENQMIFLATNTCGRISNTAFAGHSSLIDHKGKIHFELNDNESIITKRFDISDLYRYRSEFPVLNDASLIQDKEITFYEFKNGLNSILVLP